MDSRTTECRVMDAVKVAMASHRDDCPTCSKHWRAKTTEDRVGYCKEYLRIRDIMDEVDAAFNQS